MERLAVSKKQKKYRKVIQTSGLSEIEVIKEVQEQYKKLIKQIALHKKRNDDKIKFTYRR